MKKVALVFLIAVIAPSVLLGWLAVRSLRDQQFILERQQSLLYQGIADARSRSVQDVIEEQQRAFVQIANALLTEPPAGKGQRTKSSAQGSNSISIAGLPGFDPALRRSWPLAQVGFIITAEGQILSPLPQTGLLAKKFIEDNGRFLANRESAQVYWNPKQALNYMALNEPPQQQQQQTESQGQQIDNSGNFNTANRAVQFRNVQPQQHAGPPQDFVQSQPEPQASKLAPSLTEFRQLIGDTTEGALARFVDNKLSILFWCRPPQDPRMICGAELSMPQLLSRLRGMVMELDPAVKREVCLALLDENAKPVALSHEGFRGNWKRPFVASEIGEILPHWEFAIYLLNPEALTRTAQSIKLTMASLIAVLLLAIGVGSWLIVSDLNRQLTLARQKTTFVSNVSHELKTPLTSIRMFSELLLEGRVADPQKQRRYLEIITAETARLTRLINNVLDFARLERGETKYQFQDCDLDEVVTATVQAYRPHLEEAGFQVEFQPPVEPIAIHADRDAVSQVLLNLLSNAEKYASGRKEIQVGVQVHSSPVAHVEVSVADRGMGVPPGCAEKIFEKFYRAHDCLSSGIHGSGLGLTLARQIARAHGGDVAYKPREGGGSLFSLRLPLSKTDPHDSGTKRDRLEETA